MYCSFTSSLPIPPPSGAAASTAAHAVGRGGVKSGCRGQNRRPKSRGDRRRRWASPWLWRSLHIGRKVVAAELPGGVKSPHAGGVKERASESEASSCFSNFSRKSSMSKSRRCRGRRRTTCCPACRGCRSNFCRSCAQGSRPPCPRRQVQPPRLPFTLICTKSTAARYAHRAISV